MMEFLTPSLRVMPMVAGVVADFPDPFDRLQPWHGDEPAYLAHHRIGQRALDDGASFDWKSLLHSYSHAIPTCEALTVLSGLSPLIEVGAGNGYWARLLSDMGADIIATDIEPPESNSWMSRSEPWIKVKVCDAVEAARLHPDRALFSCWPPRSAGYMDDVIPVYAGSTIALITTPRMDDEGERLFDLLEEEWDLGQQVDLPGWLFQFESLMIWRRKEPRTV